MIRKTLLTSAFGLFILFAFTLQSCIKEYPVGGKGNDPDAVAAVIEVNCGLSWISIPHYIDFETKAAQEFPHHFIVEVSLNSQKICRDEFYLSNQQFSSGQITHQLSVPLSAKVYDIAVWYDTDDSRSAQYYDSHTLEDVRIINTSTSSADEMICAFASGTLDCRNPESISGHKIVTESFELKIPGARFELIATDVNQFISDNKAALDLGETYYCEVNFGNGTYSSFNVYKDMPLTLDGEFFLSGRMRLPYDKYDSLKIAEGFFFCKDGYEANLRLTVRNSASVAVSETGIFTLPAKRGAIISIYGDFLTHPLDGYFSIDNMWEGEISYEYKEE